MYFRYFVIISPWKRAGTSFEQIPQGCIVPRLVEIVLVCSGEDDFLNFNVFSLFCNFLPLEKGGALYLKKLESPSLKDVLCQVWLKLIQWFWRRRWKCEKCRTTTMTTKTTTTTDKLWAKTLIGLFNIWQNFVSVKPLRHWTFLLSIYW